MNSLKYRQNPKMHHRTNTLKDERSLMDARIRTVLTTVEHSQIDLEKYPQAEGKSPCADIRKKPSCRV